MCISVYAIGTLYTIGWVGITLDKIQCMRYISYII